MMPGVGAPNGIGFANGTASNRSATARYLIGVQSAALMRLADADGTCKEEVKTIANGDDLNRSPMMTMTPAPTPLPAVDPATHAAPASTASGTWRSGWAPLASEDTSDARSDSREVP